MTYKTEIVSICRRLYQKDWIAACDGNVSYKNSEDSIWITPAGQHKGFIEEGGLAEVTLENKILSGTPSSERLMHLAVYQSCPKARAVVHAHPPTAIAWSVARPDLLELPSEYLSEVILAVGSIPFVPYARPGTVKMGENLLPFLPAHRVMVLSNHGAIAWGESLEEAFQGIERLEHAAKILLLARQLGNPQPLAEEEIRALRQMRKNLGEKIL